MGDSDSTEVYNDILDKVRSSSLDDLDIRLNTLYEQWIVTSRNGSNLFDYMRLAISNFNCDINDLTIGTFNNHFKPIIFEIYQMYNVMCDENNGELDKATILDNEKKFYELINAVTTAENTILMSIMMMGTMTLDERPKLDDLNSNEACIYIPPERMDYGALSKRQILLLYFLNKLKLYNYKRYIVDGVCYCYTMIYNKKGHNTYAWKKVSTIEEFFYENIKSEINPDLWTIATASDNTSFIINYLTKCKESKFDDLVKDRHIFSFINGVYFAKVKNPNYDVDDPDSLKWIDKWVPFEGEGSDKINNMVVSSKYFELDFVNCSDYQDWFDIIVKHCEYFRKVMIYQEWSDEVQRWMCILIGRMLYDVGELDDWQVFVFLLGMAGSGKSLGYDTPVMMYDGHTKKVQDIVVGDTIMGDDNTPRKVLATSCGYDNMYLVRQEYGDDYVVNGDHILTLYNLETKKLVDISVNDYLNLDNTDNYVGVSANTAFPYQKCDTTYTPHYLGILVGEGTKKDTEYMDLIKYNNNSVHYEFMDGLMSSINDDDEVISNNYDLLNDVAFIARCVGYRTIIYRTMVYNMCSVYVLKLLEDTRYTNISVEPVSEEYYKQGPEYHFRYSFQIDGNQRFLLGDHTITHNSTIIEKVLKLFYDEGDVGIISNNMQKSFGLSPLVDKKIVLGPEIKGNWAIDQAELQSMVSGESISINRKFKDAINSKFKAHLAIAGNVVPEFQDNNGSMSRRTIVFPFNRKVKKGDAKLGDKINKEIAYIMQACNRGYLDAVHKYSHTGIWESLPDLFKETRDEVSQSTNSLTNFLNSDRIILGDNHYCREKIFIAAYNNFCRDSGFSSSRWTSQFYMGPFADLNLKLVKNARKKYPNNPMGVTYSGSFILGVDIKDSMLDEDDSELQ